MEIKIGVTDSPRELVVNSAESADKVEGQVRDALADEQGLLTLVDDKGRKVIVPHKRIAYVEIGPADSRRVGFLAD